MSKPRAILAVDVDEVCADMLGRVCELVRTSWKRAREVDALPTWHGEPLPAISENILPEDINGWDLKPYFGSYWHEYLTDEDFYPGVQPMPGARRGVHTLLSLGYRVIYVTSCIPGTADAKQQWLLDWGFLTEKNAVRDFFAVSDKSLVGADVLFDDAVHNVEPFPGRAFLVNHFHNRTTDCKRPRINSLLDAPNVLSAWY